MAAPIGDIVYARVGDVLTGNGMRQEVVKVTPIEQPPVLPVAMGPP
jgi:hypothetical protein